MEENKIAVFADKTVGKATVEFLLENYENDLLYIVCVDRNSLIYKDCLENNSQFKDKVIFNEDLKNGEIIDILKNSHLKYIILAWWPYIIKDPVISIPEIGVLNFHPSLLPFDKGKHYNFWTIVDESPFGVSIHFVDNSIDGGDIIFQKQISKSWEDTGETLYYRAQIAMIDLFVNSYEQIRQKNYLRIRQAPGSGSLHYGKELDNASFIDLEKSYTAKELLNKLRARTFPPHPAAWFEFEGNRYEVRIEIKKNKSEV